MPRKTPSQPVFDKARDRWRVSLPASLSSSGRRVRSWHPTREAARDYLNSITNTVDPAAVIPPALAMKADEARLILEPWGIDLVDGAKTLASVMKELGGSGTPLEAARLYAAQHAERTASKPFEEAAKLFLKTRDGLREDTLRGYRHHLINSFAGLGARMLSDITPAEIDAQLTDRPPSSRRAAQIILGVMWRWAASQPRAWCKADVIDALEPVRVSRETEIVCLTPAAAAALLRAAEATSPGCAVGFAVAVFGGVRLRELEKLTWKGIGETHIEIGADIAKRHARRLIPICPTLKAWLGAYRGDAEAEDRIVGPNWVNTSKTARRMAGWDLQSNAKNPPPASRGPWPGNCMRHTCASIQVAIGRPLEDLIFAFGHSGGSQLLKQHYLARLTKKDALAILAIGPGGKKITAITAA